MSSKNIEGRPSTYCSIVLHAVTNIPPALFWDIARVYTYSFPAHMVTRVVWRLLLTSQPAWARATMQTQERSRTEPRVHMEPKENKMG